MYKILAAMIVMLAMFHAVNLANRYLQIKERQNEIKIHEVLNEVCGGRGGTWADEDNRITCK